MIRIIKQTQRGCCTLKLKHDVVVTWDIILDYLLAKTLACFAVFISAIVWSSGMKVLSKFISGLIHFHSC
jgi:hypothetical protein